MTEEKPLAGQIEDTAGISRVNLDAEVSENAPRLHGRVLTFALAFVAGTGFTLFGYVISPTIGSELRIPNRYDQGVMSALLSAGQVCSLVQWNRTAR